ncbi:MAG: hypothetical protein J1E95_10410 [Muribaculaceae bacterium]|nr:hypothetical protein [Muribaculaceae bacterium]
MKTGLTIVESQQLLDLGIQVKKASGLKLISGPKDGFEESFEEVRYFNITDFLNGEILPKEFEPPFDGGKYTLMFYWESGKWVAGYSLPDGRELLDHHFEEVELIDALYKLTAWWRKMFFSHTFKRD